MLFIRLVSVFLSSLILLIGLLVLLRNSKKIENKTFILICFFSALWGFTYQNIEFFDNITYVRVFNAAAFLWGLLLMFAVVSFTYVFPVSKPKKSLWIYSILLLPTAVLSLTPFIAGEVVRAGTDSGYKFIDGSLATFYVIVMGIGVLLIARNLLLGRSHLNAIQRSQAKTVAGGFIFSFIIGVGLAVLFPVAFPGFTSQTHIDNLAPFALVFLIGFTAFAITRHRLFDFRLVLARSAGYILSLGVIVGGYSIIAFGIIARFVDTDGEGQQIIYIVLAVLVALTFPRIKAFFDKLSNKLFYQDAYDPQVLLDELNQVLVSTIELNKLLKNSAQIIGDTIKADFCLFTIKEQGDTPQRVVGTRERRFDDDDVHTTRKLTVLTRRKSIVTDDLEDTDKLKPVLRDNDIAVLARLSENPNKEIEGLGYLVLGPKRTGGPYNNSDIKIIEIIADEMVIAIQNALRFEEIQRFNLTLQQKVEDATRQLRRTNEKLKQMDETKDEFISMASHQLRTPLTSMKGYVSMVLEGDSGKITAMQRKLLDQAFVSSQRMVYLIADLLNVSRLRTGKFIIENKPTNLAEVVETEISQLIETAKGRDLELTYNKPKDFPTLMLDETKMRQVIMNFADNAIYYTPAGGHIHVNLEDKGDTIEYTVVDDGLGVPKAEQHHLFTKFFRAGNARKARPDGTGLGLFMAKKVIATQGGAIVFRSEEGKGSTFGFTFAKSALPAVTKQAEPAKPKK